MTYNLSNEVSFCANFITYVYCASHLTDSPADGPCKLHLKYHRIARLYHLFKLAIVNFQKISIIHALSREFYSEYSTALCEGFNLQYTWHYRITRKMPLEKPLIKSNVLDPYDIGFSQLYDLIYQ